MSFIASGQLSEVERLTEALERIRSYANVNGMFPDGLTKQQMMADVEDMARRGLGLPKIKRYKSGAAIASAQIERRHDSH